jgi:hypothetical protein
MGGWGSRISIGMISSPTQPTGMFAGQTYFNSTSGIAYIYNGTSWVMLSGTIGGLIYQGTWNANTNTPTLGNGGAGGVKGDYYVVSVAGNTSIDGVNDWEVGDWIVNNGTVWEKVDNTEAPLSTTLAVGNTTGANDISFDSGQGALFNEGTGGRLVSATTSGGQKLWALPNASGIIALLSDIPAVPTTIYTGDGVITGDRNIYFTTYIQFNSTVAGYFQINNNGYFKSEYNVNNYLEYIPASGSPLTAYSSTATITGFRANRAGTILTMVAGSSGACYIDTSTYLDFYTNSTGTLAGRINSSGDWGIGGATITAQLTVTGGGATSATLNQTWLNTSTIELMRLNDAGQLGLNTSDFSTGIGGLTSKFALRANNGDVGNHTLAFIENALNPTSNNAYYQRALTSSIVKYGSNNTYHTVGSYSVADNQGTGQVNEFYGQYNLALIRGNATIIDAGGIFSDKQAQTGTITNFASIVAHTTALSGGAITNMYGLVVKTPTNVSGGTRTNTYGVYIEPNTTGINNYGLIVAQQVSGFGTATPSQNAMVTFSSTTKAGFKIDGVNVTQAGAITAEDGQVIYVTNTDGTFTSVGFWGRENGAWVKL